MMLAALLTMCMSACSQGNFVFPRRVNGEPAHYADAYANDQDWALLFYMLVNEKDI